MPAANDHRGSFGVVVAPAATIAGVLDFVPNKFLNKPQAPLRERFDDDATVMQVPKASGTERARAEFGGWGGAE